MRNDGEVIFFFLVCLIQPLRPLDILDIDGNANLGQHCRDYLATTTRITRWWQVQRQSKAFLPRLLQQRSGKIWVVR